MSRARLAAVAAVVAALGCSSTEPVAMLPPRGQVLLYVDTDAPVPPGPGEVAAPTDPHPLFEWLSVEVFEPGATTPCLGCSRDFPLEADRLRALGYSLGVPTRPGVSGYRARVRVLGPGGLELVQVERAERAEALDAGIGDAASPDAASPDAASPDGGVAGAGVATPSWLESTVALPTVGEDGVVEATVTLRVDDLGVAQGTLDAPIAATPGKPATSLVGTWPGAARVDCPEPPRADEVCVPGGAFWMGNPAASADPAQSLRDPSQIHRLVVVSPFYMKKAEVTVREYRTLTKKDVDVLWWWNGRYGYELDSPWTGKEVCAYVPDAAHLPPSFDPGAAALHEDLPLNCVSYPDAVRYCKAWGGTLPTEAEFEYVASGLASRYYVWGTAEPTCSDVVWGRLPPKLLRDTDMPCLPEPPPPRTAASPFLVRVPADTADMSDPLNQARARDRLVLPTGTLIDLAGSVAEYARDRWNEASESCWAGSTVLRDPVCDTRSTVRPGTRSVRGGAWTDAPVSLAASSRTFIADSDTLLGLHLFSVRTGIRCVREIPK